MRRWLSTPWQRDLTLWDVVTLLSGAVLSIVHHGLIAPWAADAMRAAA